MPLDVCIDFILNAHHRAIHPSQSVDNTRMVVAVLLA
jgi:hypothetical protein